MTGCTNGFLDAFSRRFADQQVGISTNVTNDGFIHLVPTNTGRRGVDNAAQRQNSNFRRTTTNIHHHRTLRLRNRQISADGRRHGFFDQEDLSGPGIFGGFLNGATLHGCRARRNTDNNLWRCEGAVVVNLPDEVLDHLFGNFKVSDYAVAHGTDRLNGTRCPAKHSLGLVPNRKNTTLPP